MLQNMFWIHLSKAHKIALSNKIAGIINCPINKELLNKKNYGITELLASKCKVKNNSEVMLIKIKNYQFHQLQLISI